MEKEEIVAANPQDCATECQGQTTLEDSNSDIIYDISESMEDLQTSVPSEPDESSEASDQPEIKEESEIKEDPEQTSAEAQIQKMLDEVGADTLLQIIKDNRNAAIRQIISEVEASRDRSLPSGATAAPSCTSIFDLAALA